MYDFIVHIHSYTLVYTHTLIHSYTHTHTHTYIYALIHRISTGRFRVDEVHDFTQEDLNDEDIFLLDTYTQGK